MLVRDGHNLDDLKYKYTIPQVYLFYEKNRKLEMGNKRFDAICMSNAMCYASPSYDKNSARQKEKAWKKFVDSLDWNKLRQKSNLTISSVKKSLSIPGVIIKKKGD